MLTVLVIQQRKVLTAQPLLNACLVSSLVLIYLAQQMKNNIPATGSSNKIYALAICFFRTGLTNRHVGIYIRNDKFVHASTSSSVTVSAINNDYWSKRYYAACQIIDTH